MENLLKETKQILNEHGKTLDDIIWIGCEDFRIRKDDFLRLANRDYDDGYGGCEVAIDLMIVGDTWWLERHNYDGAEWWEYKEMPNIPSTVEDVFTLIRNSDSEEIQFSGIDESDYQNRLKNMRTRLLLNE